MIVRVRKYGRADFRLTREKTHCSRRCRSDTGKFRGQFVDRLLFSLTDWRTIVCLNIRYARTFVASCFSARRASRRFFCWNDWQVVKKANFCTRLTIAKKEISSRTTIRRVLCFLLNVASTNLNRQNVSSIDLRRCRIAGKNSNYASSAECL